MERALRIQGIIFCVAALITGLCTFGASGALSHHALLVLFWVILLLGVPHGALDTVFARTLHSVKRPREWAVFALLYLLITAAIVVLWLVAPRFFLVGFLLASVQHFSADPAYGTARPARLLYGGAIVVLPNLLYEAQVTPLFATLTTAQDAAALTQLLHGAAWPWAAALGVAILLQLRRNWLTACEMAALGFVAVLAPPLVAFSLYFCAMHSPRHILRTIAYAQIPSLKRLLRWAALPMLATACTAYMIMRRIPHETLDAGLMQLLFVGLAALTVPHMLLVERARIHVPRRSTDTPQI